jgi:WD40 repeat protein
MPGSAYGKDLGRDRRWPAVSVAVILDSRIAGATWPGPIKVWSADTGKELFDHALGDFPVFALSPDGRHLATRHENNVKIWDIDTRKELFTLKGHSQRVSCIAFCPHGKRIATATGMRAGYPGQGHDVKIWDAATGQQLLTLKGHAGDIRQLMFTPDGNRLYSAGIAGDT